MRFTSRLDWSPVAERGVREPRVVQLDTALDVAVRGRTIGPGPTGAFGQFHLEMSA